MKSLDECIKGLEQVQQFLGGPIQECMDLLEKAKYFLRGQALTDNTVQPGTRNDLLNLLNNIEWPVAIDPFLIVNDTSEEDKIMRAEGIIELVMNTNLTNLKFLDFGCGEGHIVRKALDFGVKSVLGYDIVNDERWKDFPADPKMEFTTDFKEVQKKGPYDFILVYDVIDHAEAESPVELLRKIKTLVSPGGKIHIRFHPWCSRHGTHLYRQINKAYVHLIFTEDQLKSMGYKPMHTIKVIHPQVTYENWMRDAGYSNVKLDNITTEEVPYFFKKSHFISSIIKQHWRESFIPELANGREFPDVAMMKQFMDYIIG